MCIHCQVIQPRTMALQGYQSSGYSHGVYKARKKPLDSFHQLRLQYIHILPANCVQCDCWKHSTEGSTSDKHLALTAFPGSLARPPPKTPRSLIWHLRSYACKVKNRILGNWDCGVASLTSNTRPSPSALTLGLSGEGLESVVDSKVEVSYYISFPGPKPNAYPKIRDHRQTTPA